MNLSDEVLYDLYCTYTLYGVPSFHGVKKAELADHATRIGIPIRKTDTRDAIIQKMLPYVLKALEMKKKSDEDARQRIEDEKNMRANETTDEKNARRAANSETIKDIYNKASDMNQFVSPDRQLTVRETIAYLQKLIDTEPMMADYTVSIGSFLQKEGVGRIVVNDKSDEIIFCC